MFGIKKDADNQKVEIDAEVHAMPADFYGGLNPVVKFKSVEKEIKTGDEKEERLSMSDKKLLNKSEAAGGGNQFHPANLFTSTKFLVIVGVGLFLIFVGGATWYYWRDINSSTGGNEQIAPPVVTPPINNEPVLNNETPTTTVTNEVVEVPTTTPAVASLMFPSILLTNSADTDKDGLTDQAEETFTTDPTIIDTDKDGYDDSHEVFNLYSPVSLSPKTLLDDGLIKEFVNPVYEYKVFFPGVWAMGSVDQNYEDVLFSALNGENIEIRTFSLTEGESFAAWFAVNAPTEKYSELVEFKSKFNEIGLKRSDGLVYYFTDSKRVFVILYHPAVNATIISYRSVINLMARSFRLANNSSIMPAQINLPINTSTPSIPSPSLSVPTTTIVTSSL